MLSNTDARSRAWTIAKRWARAPAWIHRRGRVRSAREHQAVAEPGLPVAAPAALLADRVGEGAGRPLQRDPARRHRVGDRRRVGRGADRRLGGGGRGAGGRERDRGQEDAEQEGCHGRALRA